MNGLSSLIWVTCSWIASHLRLERGAGDVDPGRDRSSGTSIFAANSSNSAICSGVASSGGAQNGFACRAPSSARAIRSRTDAGMACS